MKTLQINFFRAICSIAVGILLVMYPEDTASWITIAIGVLFLISGAISIIAYYVAKGSTNSGSPIFPIVGIGSALLGIGVIIFHSQVLDIMGYILGVILILGALNQIAELLSVMRYRRMSVWFWVCPIIVLAIGILALVKPSMLFVTPLLVLGWCLLLYGITEVVNGIKVYTYRRKIEKALALAEAEKEASTAKVEEVEDAEAIEVKDDTNSSEQELMS